jgi:type III pantothenate kinase
LAARAVVGKRVTAFAAFRIFSLQSFSHSVLPSPMPPLLCLDIGNTHTHFGVVGAAGADAMAAVPTASFDEPVGDFRALLARLHAQHPTLAGVAFCSVVPAATPRLRAVLSAALPALPIFQLTHECQLGLPITYPRPAEIGQDRLANAAGAHALAGGAAIVIDLGTAVTFDIVTARGGYEGGIIAPGVAVMRNYLHERTAQLPLLGDEPFKGSSAIGKSTIEAMQIGTVVGFTGMIQALLDAVLAELAARGEPTPTLFATGGYAEFLAGRLRQPLRLEPELTLLGLAAAWRLNR